MSEVPTGFPSLDEPSDADVDDSPTQEAKKRSTIRFPYTDIDDAVTVASMIKQVHGNGAMPVDQLAVALGGTSTKSGAFRTKLATAATFGAISNGRRYVELTDLGHRLADDSTRTAAMIEAFLAVPLYAALYKSYQDKQLPADQGLENDIRQLGVVDNQAARARQAMQRSAEKAGFFWGGRNKLVIPPAATVKGNVSGTEPASDRVVDPLRDEPSPALANPLLTALFTKMLPPEGEPFPADERRRLFRALAVNLDVIYGDQDVYTDPAALAQVFKDAHSPS